MTDHELSYKDYRVRRGELSAFGRALNSSRSLLRIIVAVGALTASIVIFAWLRPAVVADWGLKISLLLLIVLVIAGLALIWWFATRHFIEPDLAFRKWLQQVCDGDLDARIDLPRQHRHYKELDFHTRNLASSLARLSDEMESLVETQTGRLENHRRLLEMLLRLTENISGESGKSDVLNTVVQHLADWFGEATVAGYLLENDALQHVTRAVSRPPVEGEAVVPGEPAVLQASDAVPEHGAAPTLTLTDVVSRITWSTTAELAGSERVRVPFYGGSDVAGMVVIDFNASVTFDKTEAGRVLLAVAEQLTLFNNKLTAREQAERSRLIGERTRLAGDMHDSLAQTLLAARYKASLLQEALTEAGSSVWSEDVRKIAGTISEANQEIRELIREYRSPLADHRSVDSIQRAIEQFRKSSGLQVFFHSENPHMRFTPREESVVQRIVGEALTNARKYANANNMRVFLQYLSNGTRTVLIEDDGLGFNVEAMVDASRQSGVESGEHIGLSIMQERALSIGAILNIESEPGDGTRVSLKLPPLIEPEEHRS